MKTDPHSKPVRARILRAAALFAAPAAVMALSWHAAQAPARGGEIRTAPAGHETVRHAPQPATPATTGKLAPTGAGPGHALYVDSDGSGSGALSAKNAQLEEALDVEDADPQWTEQIERRARDLLSGEPAIRSVQARCAQTFCRLQVVKPLSSKLDWPEIDEQLAKLSRGEAIFQTEDHDGFSTGYLYFAADDTHLPLASLDSLVSPDEP